MPRYNTEKSVAALTGAGTFSTPGQGLYTALGGTAPYTVTLSHPKDSVGKPQTFYNSTAGDVTLTSPSGVLKGPGFSAAASQIIPANSTYTMTSDGVDYTISNNEGGPQAAVSLAVGTLTASGGVSLNPAGATVSLAPTGAGTVTINPATEGSINNVVIGNTNPANGTFDTLTVNTTITGNGTIDGGTF